MIHRFLARVEWEKLLRDIGAAPLDGKGKLNTAEWWRHDGMVFTVPVEDDGDRCEFWAIQKLREQLGGPRLFSRELNDEPDD